MVVLAGCAEPGPQDHLDEYLEKLERVLDQDRGAVMAVPMPRFPPVRDLRIDIPDESIDVIEFLQIRRCALQGLVAARNSSLGKLAGASQRLVYELEFLRLGEQCQADIAGDYPELAARLAEVLAIKRQHLPRHIFMATLGGQEFRRFFQAQGAIPARFAGDAVLDLALSQLVEDVESWLAGHYRTDVARLEHQLDIIRRGDAGAQLQAWASLAFGMDMATRIVSERGARAPLCHQGMQPPRARIFDTVVRAVFIGKIQPWAAGLNARYYETFPLVTQLELMLSMAETGPYRLWRLARNAALAHATETLPRHVNVLNPLFEQCNLMPERGDDQKE